MLLNTLAYLSLGCASYAFPADTADGKYLGQDSREKDLKLELLAYFELGVKERYVVRRSYVHKL